MEPETTTPSPSEMTAEDRAAAAALAREVQSLQCACYDDSDDLDDYIGCVRAWVTRFVPKLCALLRTIDDPEMQVRALWFVSMSAHDDEWDAFASAFLNAYKRRQGPTMRQADEVRLISRYGRDEGDN